MHNGMSVAKTGIRREKRIARAGLLVSLAIIALLSAAPSACRAQARYVADEPLPPLAAGAWTMVVIPDTQSYVDSSDNAWLLDEIVQWIIDAREERNIQLVLHEGDIVYQNGITSPSDGSGDQDSDGQWANAAHSLHKLDGILPYVIVPGNHDYGVKDCDSRETQFNDYFKPEDNFLVDPAFGGILKSMYLNAFGECTLENACYEFNAPDGRKLLILALEWGPRQAVVDWANELLSYPRYAGYTAVLLTHAYMYYDDTRLDWAAKGKTQAANPHAYSGTNADTHDGEELWRELVSRHSQFELVLSGHIGGDMVGYLASVGKHGQTVHQMLFNAQFLPRGGDGWIRLLEFQPDGRTVQVRTFSPVFARDGIELTNPWRTNEDDEFVIELSPLS